MVTVLFSDLTGYSTLCERLDPEDVREMMSLVFKEVVGIIIRYGGHIDRIIGDEVLAVFGIPRIHEDDPVRAVRSALDIHGTVARMTERFKGRLEKPLSMHSGIATGLVVTGEADPATGRHGITGDTLNRASWLTNLAKSGEVLVDAGTMALTSGFFFFEKSTRETGKGTMDTVDVHRVHRIVKRPDKIRRVQGVRSRLIGRESEMNTLRDVLAEVSRGRGCCVFLEGDAGTGKSRLISEFKNESVRLGLRWLQGNAFTYTRGMPYFPLIDLLGRSADLREDDSEDVIRQKLAEDLGPLTAEDGTFVLILERLFTLSHDNAARVTPELWKIKLGRALVRLIRNQSRTGVTVICIEDLHWADPSTVGLFQFVLNEANLPVLFLVSLRPGQRVFSHSQITNPYYRRCRIPLKDLSPEKSEAMVRSLLGTKQVPRPLLNFITEHLGGNPFFLEELINSLIDTGTLHKEGAFWQVNGAIGNAAFSSNISSVIAARLDRLAASTKRIVQEASVIGRRFAPAVLKQITSCPDQMESSLNTLRSLGLIVQSDDPGEKLCAFKHTLVQDVAYNSLLKRQRKDMHEKTARVLESQNPDRIDALCETLALHFRKGHSFSKAVDYLEQAGRKGLKKYAVIESHNYYEKAYEILVDRERLTDGAPRRALELLLEWFFVFNLRGRFGDALTLLKRHESAARSSTDLQLKGMYLTCMGWAYQRREALNLSRDCLMEALSIGTQIENHKVVAYACAVLIWTCTDLGRLDEAVAFAARAEEASRFFESEDASWFFKMDQDLVRFVLTGAAIAHWFRGDCRQCRKLGDRLLVYGEDAGEVNSISEGHLAHGMGCFAAGDYRGAIEKCMTAIDMSADPLFALNARFLMAYAHLSLDEVSQAEINLQKIITFCKRSGYEYIGTSADALLSSVVAVARGNVGAGVKALDRHARQYMADGKKYHAQTFHYMLGRIYLQVALREGGVGLSTVVKNLPFLVAHLPRAARHAEHHFKEAIRIADRINALGIKGQASLDLGRLYQAKRRSDLSMPLIKESIDLFKQLGADRHLQRAQAVLAGME